MRNFSDIRKMRTVSADMSVDQGLRSYMIAVYALMGLGLLLTALSSYILSSLSINIYYRGLNKHLKHLL